MAAEELFIGLMSGTSLDGVDGVLADFSGGRIAVKSYATAQFPVALRAELLALNTPGDNELHRAALAGNGLARAYAGVVAQLLADSGTDAGAMPACGVMRPQYFRGLSGLRSKRSGTPSPSLSRPRS